MDSKSLLRRLTADIELGEAKSSFIDCESPLDDLEFCVDPTYKVPKWRAPEQEKLRRQKKLADKQHNRKKSRASKAARRINR